MVSGPVCRTYVVIAPQIVRAGSTYDVVVTSLRATSSVTVDVTLKNARNVSIAANRITFSPGQHSALFSRSLSPRLYLIVFVRIKPKLTVMFLFSSAHARN